MQRYQMLIGGEWVDAEGGATFESENPYLGAPWALIPRATPSRCRPRGRGRVRRVPRGPAGGA